VITETKSFIYKFSSKSIIDNDLFPEKLESKHILVPSLFHLGCKSHLTFPLNFNGEYNLDKAIELIQRNSRHYAKKQLSWYRRDPEMHWFRPDEIDNMIHLIETHKS